MKTQIRFRTDNLQSTRYGRITLGWLGELCLLATIACATIATLYFCQQHSDLPTATAARSERMALAPEHSPIYGMSISSDKGRVMVVRSGQMAQSLSIQPGEMQPDQGTEAGVSCVEFLPDGRRLVLGHRDGSVWLRNRDGSDIRLNVPVLKQIVRMAFSRDGERLVIGDEIGQVAIWNMNSMQSEGQFRVGRRRVEALAISPDGRYLVAAGHYAATSIRDAKSGEVKFTFDNSENGTCTSCIFSKDGRQLICGYVNGQLNAYDMQTQELLWERPLEGRQSVLSLALSPDGKSFACGSLNPYVEIHDVGTGATLNTFPAHRVGVRCLCYLPEANFLVSAGYDGKVRMWHQDDWCPLYRL